MKNPTLRELCRRLKPFASQLPRLRELREGSREDFSLVLCYGHNFDYKLVEAEFMAAQVNSSISVWGLEGDVTPIFDQKGLPIHATAAMDADLLKNEHQSRPVVLVGYCVGGLNAYETAKQLRSSQYPVLAIV